MTIFTYKSLTMTVHGSFLIFINIFTLINGCKDLFQEISLLPGDFNLNVSESRWPLNISFLFEPRPINRSVFLFLMGYKSATISTHLCNSLKRFWFDIGCKQLIVLLTILAPCRAHSSLSFTHTVGLTVRAGKPLSQLEHISLYKFVIFMAQGELW